MPITFEEIEEDFGRVPLIYQDIASKYLIDKRFNSLEEALSQEYQGHDLKWHGFYARKESIGVKYFEDEFHTHPVEVPILRAKLID